MITIIFGTYNGAKTIGRMFEQLCLMTLPPVGLEILMVNNASTDDTVKVALSFVDRLPLKIIHENNRGKNIALNRGIDQANGDLLIFTDDDVLPDKDWLIKLWECSEKNKDVDLIGGRILPAWDEEPFSIFLNSVPLTAAYGITPVELKAGMVDPGAVWGANMCVRKRIFEAGFRFNENVGPGPGNYIMGSEVEFNSRLGANGYKAWYCPEAIVHHIIPSDHTTNNWIAKRAYKFGKMICSRKGEQINHGQITALCGIQLGFPRWMLTKLISEWLIWGKSKINMDTSTELKHLWKMFHHMGHIVQAWKSRKMHR